LQCNETGEWLVVVQGSSKIVTGDTESRGKKTKNGAKRVQLLRTPVPRPQAKGKTRRTFIKIWNSSSSGFERGGKEITQPSISTKTDLKENSRVESIIT